MIAAVVLGIVLVGSLALFSPGVPVWVALAVAGACLVGMAAIAAHVGRWWR